MHSQSFVGTVHSSGLAPSCFQRETFSHHIWQPPLQLLQTMQKYKTVLKNRQSLASCLPHLQYDVLTLVFSGNISISVAPGLYLKLTNHDFEMSMKDSGKIRTRDKLSL